MGAYIRRLQSNLIYGGMGVIIFMVWTIAKFVMMEYTNPIDIPHIEGLSDRAVQIIIFGLAVVIIGIDALLRIYIGKSAISEGRGDFKKTPAYIVIAVVFLVLSMVSYYMYVFAGKKELFEDIPGLIVDMTSSLMLFQIIFSAIRLRVYRKGQGL